MNDQANSSASSCTNSGNNSATMEHERRHELEQDKDDKEHDHDDTDNTNMDDNDNDNDNDDGLVWYFSYGSNMNPQVFEEKRKIQPLDHMVCRIPGYVLTYTEGILPYLEPAFCTCVPRERLPALRSGRPRPTIHGVAFLITRDQFEHVLLTEGGFGYQYYEGDSFWALGHYGVEDVECVEIDDDGNGNGNGNGNDDAVDDEPTEQGHRHRQGRTVRAKTLVGLLGARQRYDCNASKRYYNLVKEGAKSSGLPKFYRDYLRDEHPAYADPTCESSSEPSATATATARWGVAIAKTLYIVIYIPCILIMSTMQFYFRRNERRLLALHQDPQRSSSSSSSSSSHFSAPTPKQRNTQRKLKPFADVVRPPWIMLKVCALYTKYVVDLPLQTILFDWCKIPCGFHNQHRADAHGDNDCGTAEGTTNPSTTKTKHE